MTDNLLICLLFVSCLNTVATVLMAICAFDIETILKRVFPETKRIIPEPPEDYKAWNKAHGYDTAHRAEPQSIEESLPTEPYRYTGTAPNPRKAKQTPTLYQELELPNSITIDGHEINESERA